MQHDSLHHMNIIDLVIGFLSSVYKWSYQCWLSRPTGLLYLAMLYTSVFFTYLKRNIRAASSYTYPALAQTLQGGFNTHCDWLLAVNRVTIQQHVPDTEAMLALTCMLWVYYN